MFRKDILLIKKTSFVRAGGRHFRYCVYSVMGNTNNIGFGKGKSGDLSSAIKKSYDKAKQNIFRVCINFNMFSCYYGEFCKSRVLIGYSKLGYYVGGIVRKIFNILSINNIYCKVFGTKNSFNIINIIISILKK